MINTLLEAIERYESSEEAPEFDLSAELETSVVPTIALENSESDDDSFHVDTNEDTSDYSDDSKDILESAADKALAFHNDPIQIKRTLKDKIRFRRQSEGVGDITNLFEPPIHYQLTEEEEKKNEIRKQRNRRSANKSRLKRIAYEKKLEQDAVDLEKEHEKLTKEVEDMKKVKLVYFKILQHHMQTCPRVPDVLKQRIYQRKHAMNAVSSSVTPAVSLQNVGTTSPMSKNQLLLSYQDSPLPQYPQQPSNFYPDMKRNIKDSVPIHPAKVPRVWNSSQSSNYNSNSAQDSTQPCISSSFSDNLQMNVATICQTRTCDIAESVSAASRIGNQDTTLCEIPINCTTIQTPSCGATSYPFQPVSASIASSLDKLSGKEGLKANVIEEQKINQIKKHLLDGFKMSTDR